MRDRIRAEAEWQFDFSAGLFLRAVLLQISDDQHILILTTHHIVSDAWSMGILTRELWTLYEAYANGRPSPLQESAYPVCGLRGLATRVAARGGAGIPAFLLEESSLRILPVLNLAHRSSEAGEAEFSRRKATAIAARVSDQSSQ